MVTTQLLSGKGASRNTRMIESSRSARSIIPLREPWRAHRSPFSCTVCQFSLETPAGLAGRVAPAEAEGRCRGYVVHQGSAAFAVEGAVAHGKVPVIVERNIIRYFTRSPTPVDATTGRAVVLRPTVVDSASTAGVVCPRAP